MSSDDPVKDCNIGKVVFPGDNLANFQPKYVMCAALAAIVFGKNDVFVPVRRKDEALKHLGEPNTAVCYFGVGRYGEDACIRLYEDMEDKIHILPENKEAFVRVLKEVNDFYVEGFYSSGCNNLINELCVVERPRWDGQMDATPSYRFEYAVSSVVDFIDSLCSPFGEYKEAIKKEIESRIISRNEMLLPQMTRACKMMTSDFRASDGVVVVISDPRLPWRSMLPQTSALFAITSDITGRYVGLFPVSREPGGAPKIIFPKDFKEAVYDSGHYHIDTVSQGLSQREAIEVLKAIANKIQVS